MAGKELTEENAAQEENLNPSTHRRALPSVLKVGGFVTAVIVIECVLAYYCLPSASQTSAWADAHFAQEGEKTAELADLEGPKKEVKPTKEVDLETFSITAYQPMSNTTLRVDFHLYATIFKEDESEFNKIFEQDRHRFRELVIVTIRSSDISDLNEAGLGLIKRKVLEKTNRMFGHAILQSLIVSEFSTVEQ